jgi:hypothetical protein
VARLMREDGLKGCPKRRFRRLPKDALHLTLRNSGPGRAGCIWRW